jgi:hypothetical protein
VGQEYTAKGWIIGLAEHWNGTAWAAQTFDNFSVDDQPFGVSCGSATTCTAVGYYLTTTGASYTLIEYWNGSTWATQSTPNPSGYETAVLGGVSCPTASDCTAGGYWETAPQTNEKTLAEQWTG